MIVKLFVSAFIGLLQLVAGQNISLADPWNLKSVYVGDDGFTTVLTLTLGRGVVITHCGTAWKSPQRTNGATPTGWVNCADENLKFRILSSSFTSTHDFVVHLLTTEFSKKTTLGTSDTLPIYETLIHFTQGELPSAFDGIFFSSKVLLDCSENREKLFNQLPCRNETGTGAEQLKAFTINKVVQALRISNVTVKNDKRGIDFTVEDVTLFGLGSPKVRTNCHARWPTTVAPEISLAKHATLCEDKSVTFYLTTDDGLDINNDFSLHVDHVFEETGEYSQFPVPMGLWFTVSGDAEFKPGVSECDQRERVCSFGTENELRMNLTFTASSTKPRAAQ